MCVGTAEWVERKRMAMMDPESRERQVVYTVIVIAITANIVTMSMIMIIRRIIMIMII